MKNMFCNSQIKKTLNKINTQSKNDVIYRKIKENNGGLRIKSFLGKHCCYQVNLHLINSSNPKKVVSVKSCAI